MEKRKFEEAFQDAFKDAEANPSEIVWTNIELELEKAEGGKMKRRLLFFQTLAAASIVFAILMGGIGYYFLKDSTDIETMANQSDFKPTPSEKLNEQKTRESIETTETESSVSSPAAPTQDNNKQDLLTQREKESAKEKLLTDNAEAGQTAHPKVKTSPEDVTPSEHNRASDSQQKSIRLPNHQRKDINTQVPIENSIASTPSEKDGLQNGEIDVAEKNNVAVTDNKKSDNVMNNNILSSNDKVSLLDAGKNDRMASQAREHLRSLPPFFKLEDPTLKIENNQPDPGALLIARLAAEEQAYAMQDKQEKKNKSEKLWTSVGFAAGAFNALNPTISPMPSNSLYYNANASSTAAKQSKASGLAYSIGVNVGTKLSKRWVLQGGVNYLTQMSDYTANSVVVDNNLQSPQAESINVYKSQVQMTADVANTKVAPTVPYTVNNNVQFLSVPVQAGYLFVNRKFGLQLNAGVSTDLFLQNTISPEAGGISSTTQGRGEDSPYRSLNFSGLMGTEFSYKLGSRYRVAVNPGLRYPFNSLYKANTGVQSTPLTFDVGLRFRYIFH